MENFIFRAVTLVTVEMKTFIFSNPELETDCRKQDVVKDFDKLLNGILSLELAMIVLGF